MKKIKTKAPSDELKYKKVSNYLTVLKDSAKTLYYQNLFSNAGHDSKKTWKIINDVIKYKKPTHNNIDSIYILQNFHKCNLHI